LQVKPAPLGQFQYFDTDAPIPLSFASDGHTMYFIKIHAGFVGLTIFKSGLPGNLWSKS
jgi:hypothetical protein